MFKKIELIGVSKTDFMDAVNNALKEAAKTVRGIRWIEVESFGAKVEDDAIKEYQATVKIAFEVKR